MKLLYKYSKINGDLMEFATPQNRIPTVEEVKKSQVNENHKLIADDGLIIFGGVTYCECRVVVGNDLSVNLYGDFYHLYE